MLLPQEVCTYRAMMYLVAREGRWFSYQDMVEYIGFDLESCKKAMKVLESDGYAIHRPMVDDDGKPNGSGWFATNKHRELKATGTRSNVPVLFSSVTDDEADTRFLTHLYNESRKPEHWAKCNKRG
jgi:general stress protein 26